MPDQPRIIIVGEEILDARGLATLLRAHTSFSVSWFDSFHRARRLLCGGRAELVLWVGNEVSTDVIKQALELRRVQAPLALCLLGRGADAQALKSLLVQGADRFAFVLRGRALDIAELVSVLEGVLSGKSTLEPAAVEKLLAMSDEGEGPLDALTSSERETLELLSEGLRNREIARRLWKSEKAIEKHVSQVFAKLGLGPSTAAELDRRVTAARLYLAHGKRESIVADRVSSRRFQRASAATGELRGVGAESNRAATPMERG